MPEVANKSVIELSKKGSRLFRSGQLEDAEQVYLEAKEIDERKPLCAFWAGRCLSQNESLQRFGRSV